MAASSRDARRRKRILEGGQDRLALITGRKQNFSADISNDSDSSFDSQSTTPVVAHHLSLNQPGLRHELTSDPPPPISESQDEGEEPSDTSNSTHNQPPKLPQIDPLTSQTNTEPLTRKPDPITEQNRGESSTQAPPPKPSSIATQLTQRIPISQLSVQQVTMAVSETEHNRMLFTMVMSIVVVLSSCGFPILRSFLFRRVILFRPMILVILVNLGQIARRLIPENQKNLARARDGSKAVLGDRYAWAEEAGRALEISLIVQSVVSAVFMDCSVYAAIVVFGLSLFGCSVYAAIVVFAVFMDICRH